MRLVVILFLFLAIKSFGQADTIREEKMLELLKEKGWSISSFKNPGDIQLDDNGVEFFHDFHANSFKKSIEFRKARIRYPVTYLELNKNGLTEKNGLIKNWGEIEKDSLVDTGKHYFFIFANPTRIISWTKDNITIQNIFTAFENRWYLTEIIVTKSN